MVHEYNKIIISDWKIPVSIGVYDFEKSEPQMLIFSFEIGFLKGEKFTFDEIGRTLNYENIIDTVKSSTLSRHYNLLENLAESICSDVLKIEGTNWINLKIEKPAVLQNEHAGLLGIEILRTKIS